MEFLNTLPVTAGMLGLFIAVPLISMHRQRFANFYLGMFLLSFSFLSLASSPLYYSRPQLFGLLDWPLSCLGAFYYLYVRTICGHKFRQRHLLHFLPLLIYSIILLDSRFRIGLIGRLSYLGLYLLFFQVVTVVYAVLVIFLLKKYKQALHCHYSSDKGRDLNWLIWLSFIFIFLLLFWIPGSMLGGWWGQVLNIGRLLVLFLAGWYGVRQHVVFIEHVSTVRTPVIQELLSGEKYQRSGMNDEVRARIEKNLGQRMMISHDFLKSDLKLVDLAEAVDVSSQHLSEYFSKVLGKNFFAYINELRTAEAERLLGDPGSQDLSILDIAFASGFNSKSTFNASFKKNRGISPSVCREKTRQAS